MKSDNIYRSKENFAPIIQCTDEIIYGKMCKENPAMLKDICRKRFPCPYQKPNHLKCEVTSKEQGKHVYPSVVCDQDLGFGETKSETNIKCPGTHPYFDLNNLICIKGCPKGKKFKVNKYNTKNNDYIDSYKKQGRCVEKFTDLNNNLNNNFENNSKQVKYFIKTLIFGLVIIILKNNKKSNKIIKETFPKYFELVFLIILLTFIDTVLEPILHYLINLLKLLD